MGLVDTTFDSTVIGNSCGAKSILKCVSSTITFGDIWV